MKKVKEVKSYILEIYGGMGKNPNELIDLIEEGWLYKVKREDGAIAEIQRMDADDYIDSKRPVAKLNAKLNIEKALKQFKPY